MAEHIELKYSDLDSVKAGLSVINTNYLDVAYRQLKQSTDLGSSIMQAGWKFGGKDKIFNAVRNAEKQIQRIENGNNKIISVINQIKQAYETGTFTAKKSNNAAWYKKALAMAGIAAAAVATPSITIPAFTVWAGRKIVSSVTKASDKKTSGLSSTAKKWSTIGTTPIRIKDIIKPTHTAPDLPTAEQPNTVQASAPVSSPEELQEIYNASANAVTGGNPDGSVSCALLTKEKARQHGFNPEWWGNGKEVVGNIPTETDSFRATKYQGDDCLRQMLAAEGEPITDVVVSFPQSPKYGTQYGHVVYIDQIVDGKVYFSDNTAPGQAKIKTVDEFLSSYYRYNGAPSGCAHLKKK